MKAIVAVEFRILWFLKKGVAMAVLNLTLNPSPKEREARQKTINWD
jgi:hypothetical protein